MKLEILGATQETFVVMRSCIGGTIHAKSLSWMVVVEVGVVSLRELSTRSWWS